MKGREYVNARIEYEARNMTAPVEYPYPYYGIRVNKLFPKYKAGLP